MQPLTLTLLQIFSVAQKRVAEQTRTGEKPVLWAWFEGSPVPGWRDDGWQAWAGPTCVLRSRGSPCCPRGSVRPRTGGQACCARPWGGKRGSGRGDLDADNLTAQPRANEVGSLQFQWKRLRPAEPVRALSSEGGCSHPAPPSAPLRPHWDTKSKESIACTQSGPGNSGPGLRPCLNHGPHKRPSGPAGAGLCRSPTEPEPPRVGHAVWPENHRFEDQKQGCGHHEPQRMEQQLQETRLRPALRGQAAGSPHAGEGAWEGSRRPGLFLEERKWTDSLPPHGRAGLRPLRPGGPGGGTAWGFTCDKKK